MNKKIYLFITILFLLFNSFTINSTAVPVVRSHIDDNFSYEIENGVHLNKLNLNSFDLNILNYTIIDESDYVKNDYDEGNLDNVKIETNERELNYYNNTSFNIINDLGDITTSFNLQFINVTNLNYTYIYTQRLMFEVTKNEVFISDIIFTLGNEEFVFVNCSVKINTLSEIVDKSEVYITGNSITSNKIYSINIMKNESEVLSFGVQTLETVSISDVFYNDKNETLYNIYTDSVLEYSLFIFNNSNLYFLTDESQSFFEFHEIRTIDPNIGLPLEISYETIDLPIKNKDVVLSLSSLKPTKVLIDYSLAEVVDDPINDPIDDPTEPINTNNEEDDDDDDDGFLFFIIFIFIILPMIAGSSKK